MAWKIVVVGKGRDNNGRISLDVEYRDASTNAKQESKQFVFERGTTRKMAIAQMRAYALVALELRAVDDSLDTQVNVSDEVPV